ncbi:hypothetical protein BJV78DRAFT_1363193 [Lactifluus subvellereus]|nr:hypothetical protein BJV78DRAFT_1363193 [Lactifluus subvellereus]
MGPAQYSNHRDDSDQIADLQLAAHAARAAKLHARLMATLDTLDSERHAYSEEISCERRQRVALQAQLRAARAERATMEAERDSLREGVLHLIEKVEVCNDYSLWPHSGLASTSLAAPPKPRHPHEQTQSTWTASTRAYSAALITALREECERERTGHAESLRRVAELEAQLARREAELEERYDKAPTPRIDSPLPGLSRDGAIRVLQQSAARNEALTHEITGLVLKLEDAHAALEPSPIPAMTPSPPPLLRRASSPESPTPQRRPSPLLLNSPRNSHSTSRTRGSPRSPTLPPLSARVASPPDDLARQIAAVTQDLAGLHAEEQRLTQVQMQSRTVPLHQRDASSGAAAASSKSAFQRVLLIEEECIRLRAELAASTAREAALRELLGPAPAPVPTEEDIFGNDVDDGEPMDLATPLQPTVLLDLKDLWPG